MGETTKKQHVKSGYCMYPSLGSHQTCDNNPNTKAYCPCDCHQNMAPYDAADAQIRAEQDAAWAAKESQ